jgi:superfamily II DNA helicase RecQ
LPFFALANNNKTTTKYTQQQQQQHNMALQAVALELAYLPWSPSIRFSIAAHRIFDNTAYQWQTVVAGRLITGDINNLPLALLVVRPTGGGKSLVRDIVGIVLGGVALTIVPLLSLGADQTLKVNSQATQDCLTAAAFHLDELSLTEFDNLHSGIADLAPGSTKLVHLFSSPQALLKPTGKRILDLLFHRKILRLIDIDEIHLFVHFARSFRSEFKALRPVLFDRVRATPGSWTHLLVSIIMMTATCSSRIQHDIQQLKVFHSQRPR